MKNIYLITTLISLFTSNFFADSYRIQTSSGITVGHVNNNVLNWDDIPYAEPPVGDLRWKAPRTYNSYDRNNIIQSREDNFCVQQPSGLGGSNGDGFFWNRGLFIFRY